jgi:glycosyltransferase involved in cell wall biosynthesis
MMKCIALVEWNWVGHHPTYFNHFILAMEELGVEVLALCPDPCEAEELANKTRQETDAASPRCGLTRFKKLETPAQRFGHVRPRRVGAIDWAIRHFTGIEDQIREWTRESGRKVDAIVYACIYDREFEWVRWAQPFLKIPWTGLYLHAMTYRMPGRFRPHTNKLPCPEKIFHGRLCKSIGTLDEGIVERFSNAVGKPVVALPDLADGRPAMNAEEMVLGDRLKEFAAGRPVVGLFGHLQESKGLLTFLEAARLPDASGICFALAGDMLWPFEEAKVHQIQLALAECPNLWTHMERIPTEPCLNHLMAACDVLSAAYIDFPHSSGIQAKAAMLGKPLIVSDGYLMAERTSRFKLGEIVPQGNARALLDAILKITSDPAAWVDHNNPQWVDYGHEHSFDRFRSSLKELLAPILDGSALETSPSL